MLPISPNNCYPSPRSIQAFKGEGEEKTEVSACAKAQALTSSLVLGRRERPPPPQANPLTLHWGGRRADRPYGDPAPHIWDGSGEEVVWLWGLGLGLHLHFVLSVGFWVGDGRSGTQFQGAGGQPGSAPCSCVTWQTSEGFSPEGVSTTSFSVWLDPLGGVGNTFSRCRRWVKGESPRGTTGEIFQGLNSPRFFGRAPI